MLITTAYPGADTSARQRFTVRFPTPSCAASVAIGLALMLALTLAAVPAHAAHAAQVPTPELAKPGAEVKPPARRAVKPRAKPAAKASASRARDVKPAAHAEAPASTAGTATPESWEIVMADRTLNAAMARWAATAGWQLLWELPVDYAVLARTTVPGRFEDAVTLVVNSMEGAEIPMKAVFYRGNRVLRIMAKGAQ